MKKRFMAFIFAGLIVASSASFAHSGRTDANGGHWNRKNGTYHFHNGGSSSGGSSGGSKSNGTTATRKPSTPKATKTPIPSTPRPTTAPLSLYQEGAERLYGKTNASGINLREAPTSKSHKVGSIRAQGTAFEIIETAKADNGKAWYLIWYQDAAVYIFAEYVDLISQEDYLAGR